MRRYHSSLLPAFAAATLLIGASILEPLARGGDSVPEPENGTDRLISFSGPTAQAIRTCDLAQAEAELSGTGPSPRNSIEPGLVLGLGAASCGRHSAGLKFLRATPHSSEFEDWRLYAIARSAIELGQHSVAQSALDSLRKEHPESPLSSAAIVAAAELAAERGDLESIAEIARENLSRLLDREDRVALEMAAWQAGATLDSAALRREVAVRLLVEHPITASKLEVIEEFRAPDGSLEWLAFLDHRQVVQRAESLMREGLLDSAIDTLALIPEADRNNRWHLVLAATLTASRRGEDALSVLESVTATSGPEESELEWRRAFAALEVSRARPGRELNQQQRQMMRERAHGHLERVVQLGLEPERSMRALRVLFEDTLEADRFEEALAILRRLKSFDPEDKSGARHLWRYGWKQYQQRNHSGAIGYWTELSDLYPTSTYNRSGLYWSARAHEVLGNTSRSKHLLEQVAAVPFTDFYRRQALRRLDAKDNGEVEPEPATPTETWPRDPILSRAESLAGWGLDRAALTEIGALNERADSRATGALKSLVLSAAGEWRKSIIEIKRVFSHLGSPYQGLAPDRAQHLYYPLAFDRIIEQNASRNGLDRNLVLAMIRQESAFDASAHSRAGARGLMQVMPATGKEIARRLGLSYSRERLSDPAFSIRLGTTYYKQVRTMFGDDEELALAGYNAGPYRIKRLWREAGNNAEIDRFLESLRYEETKSYVKRVLLFADSYRRLYPIAEPGSGPAARSAAG